MQKLILSSILIFSVYFNIQAEVQLKITLLNGTENIVSTSDSIDEIFGVKSHLSFNEKGKCITKYEHKSPIKKIDNISELVNLKKVSLYMELNSFSDFTVFESNKIESLCMSFGLSEDCLFSMQKMPMLKIVYLQSMEINSMENIDLSNTQLEYFEISSSNLTKVNGCKFPKSLQYLNIRGNEYIEFDSQTIDDINMKQITVVTDKMIEGITKQIIGNEYYRLLPETFRSFGP
ncbi:hypothetical protein K7J14_15030 [Treponema zuelzerae]|uniref:Leucine-rich repeat domain-containing protein n=1 Tax=Teretinema zuelzerae TaxID=156 RepID=A0AAE3EKN1_9SPIR|nr:hypothetical protein [Teretinema zuelzerae]MCD1656011.1 hypothetical protein [Teretinema zuelzerae]